MIDRETLRDLICDHADVREEYKSGETSLHQMIERAVQIEDEIYDMVTGEYIEENGR